MNVIVTFKKNGEECICSVISDNPERTLHSNNVYRQRAEWIRHQMGNNTLEYISDISLGYAFECMPNFYSEISDVKIRRGKQWEDKLYQSAQKKMQS